MKALVFGTLISGVVACSSSSTPPPGPVCGDGHVDAGEQCDDGTANGTAGDPCSATCTTVTAQQGHISATWHLDSVDANGNLTQDVCPSGFDTAALHTVAASPDGTALDACTSANSNCFIDLFTCSAFAGLSSPLPAQNYLTWVEITDHGGTNVYATSTAKFVDITTTDMNFDTHILTDGGYFELTWTLMGETSGNTLTCAQTAAATSAGGSVETTATLNGSTVALSDKFNCEDHFGYSDPLPAGTYTIAVDALNSANQALGSMSTTLTNETIGATPNDIVKLGNVTLGIAGM